MGVSVCASSRLPMVNLAPPLPIVNLYINDYSVNCLIDSGCTSVLVSKNFVKKQNIRITRCATKIQMLDGKCTGSIGTCELNIRNSKSASSITVEALILSENLFSEHIDVILGMMAIRRLGGMTIHKDGSIEILSKIDNFHSHSIVGCTSHIENYKEKMNGDKEEKLHCPVVKSLSVEDKDFLIEFDGSKWTVAWKWSENEALIKSTVSQYEIPEKIKPQFEAEIKKWIENGWLTEYNGPSKCMLPLMAVVQEYKSKVRPVLDYRNLNQFVSSHTAESVVCHETLRKWRKMGSQIKFLDLKNAYLQIFLNEKLWPYQVVKYNSKTYCLNRLGFGLNVAPKIMNAILKTVLSQSERVRKGTDSYIDDIAVNLNIVSIEEVQELLKKYGLEFKEPETLGEARVLGLRTFVRNDICMWKRDNTSVIDEILNKKEFTKRDIFSYSGKLVGHYPVCNWLRPCCSYIKRCTNGLNWDEKVSFLTEKKIHDLAEWVKHSDPVKGQWEIKNTDQCRVWCDSSSIAMGVVLESDNTVIEDASWLRHDNHHINVAELESVIKGINLAISCGFTKIDVLSDSATVVGWINYLLEESKRIKASGLAEMLVKRRVNIVKELIEAFDLNLKISLVRSNENKADALTRVPKSWLTEKHIEYVATAVETNNAKFIKEVHEKCHGGLNRTLYAVNKIYPELNCTKNEVKEVIGNCCKCLSIDPSSIKYDHGELSCNRIWEKAALDVTHYENKRYLVLIDCGPSRYAFWRLIKDETAGSIIKELQSIFYEIGPPSEILLDNYPSFKSEAIKKLLEEWNVRATFRCANRAQGNGIVERHNRTIKRMAKRSNSTIENAVYWYNNTVSKSMKIPHLLFFNRLAKLPLEKAKEKYEQEKCIKSRFHIGQEVYLKPPNAKCTDEWLVAKITGNPTHNSNIEVNGTMYHISHIRAKPKQIREEDTE